MNPVWVLFKLLSKIRVRTGRTITASLNSSVEELLEAARACDANEELWNKQPLSFCGDGCCGSPTADEALAILRRDLKDAIATYSDPSSSTSTVTPG